ncbi:hypothetical protein GcC1_002021 [Golovinomyces cichoracearum]|uniref:Uncharacterized protein n=1 Tax=Golovinomyces cichoracearum TaxID=62708 RepID=A0A420J9H9_9PEZI|nr:hypothetical protein GcC1_002021 [Golovinomyces cichoracearum]
MTASRRYTAPKLAETNNSGFEKQSAIFLIIEHSTTNTDPDGALILQKSYLITSKKKKNSQYN